VKIDNLDSKARYLPKSLFPTPIWSIPLQDTGSIDERLSNQLNELQLHDDNIVRSNQGGWHSHYNLHRLEQLKPVCDYFTSIIGGCFKALRIDPSLNNVVIREMWLNVNKHGDYNRNHLHP